MKKYKITIITAGALGLTFFVLLVVTAFGGFKTSDYYGGVARTLIFALGACFLLFIALALRFASPQVDTLKEISVDGKSGQTKITPAVVKKLIRKNVAPLSGVRLLSTTINLTEFGVKLVATFALSGGRRVEETSALLRELISDVCLRELNLTFHDVEIRVTDFHSVYVPDLSGMENKTKTTTPITKEEIEPKYINADIVTPPPVMTEEDVDALWAEEIKDDEPSA